MGVIYLGHVFKCRHLAKEPCTLLQYMPKRSLKDKGFFIFEAIKLDLIDSYIHCFAFGKEGKKDPLLRCWLN